MNSQGGRGGSDRSLAVKAHDHALAAIQFAKEHRYREAAEMHLTSGTYFKKLQTLLKQENEIDTATSLGLLVHHHMFMQEEMNKQAEQFEKLPEKQQQQRRSSVGLEETSAQPQEVDKSVQDGSDASIAHSNTNSNSNSNPKQQKGNSLEQRQHAFSRSEVDQVVRDFDQLASMEESLQQFPSRPKGFTVTKTRPKKMEDSFFMVDDKNSKRYPARGGSSRSRLNAQEVVRFEESVRKMEDFKAEYQQKFFKLKRSLEEFKNICGVAFESRLRELHSTDTAALLERYQEEVHDLKMQLKQEKAKRIKVQSELDRYARHVAKSKRQQMR